MNSYAKRSCKKTSRVRKIPGHRNDDDDDVVDDMRKCVCEQFSRNQLFLEEHAWPPTHAQQEICCNSPGADSRQIVDTHCVSRYPYLITTTLIRWKLRLLELFQLQHARNMLCLIGISLLAGKYSYNENVEFTFSPLICALWIENSI